MLLPAPSRSTLRSRPTRRGRAFSLLEVVVAVGIFSIGMVAVLGLFTPVAKSVSAVQDAEAAANVAALVASRLQGLPFAVVSPLLKVSSGPRTHQLTDADNAPNSPAADPTRDTQLIFANRDGSKIGRYRDAIWGNLDTEKFFEIALIRNETLSPETVSTTDSEGNTVSLPADDAALFLAYTARIRWPAFVPDPTNARRAVPAGANPTGTVRFDNSKKQVLHFAGLITR